MRSTENYLQYAVLPTVYMSVVHNGDLKIIINLFYFRGRFNLVHQKTANAKKVPVKRVTRSNHLPKLNP